VLVWKSVDWIRWSCGLDGVGMLLRFECSHVCRLYNVGKGLLVLTACRALWELIERRFCVLT
jgi:hypothetical protein